MIKYVIVIHTCVGFKCLPIKLTTRQHAVQNIYQLYFTNLILRIQPRDSYKTHINIVNYGHV